MLQAYLKENDLNEDDYLLKSRKGKNQPITRQQAYTIIKNAAKEANIDVTIGTHSLRKTFAYHAYKMGKDITMLMELLNHSSPRTTLRYIGITQENKDRVYFDINL